MKTRMKVYGMALPLLLAAVGPLVPASAAVVWSDGLNEYITANTNIEGQENEPFWAGGDFMVLDGPQSSVPVGWRFSQSWWNGEHIWHVEPDAVLKTEGAASARFDPGSGDYQDIFAGIWITGLVVGQQYQVTFDFQADVGFVKNGPGKQAGDDHVPSASFNVMNVADNPTGWLATEDYPGHLTGSTWIGDPSHWDGSFHQQFRTFDAVASEMAFVLKVRSMNSPGSFRIDNLVVTPEPASIALLALAGLACLRRQSR